MVTEMIPAVYENGAFQVSVPLPDLPEHQAVELFYVVVDKPFDSISENGSSNGVEKHFINNNFVDSHPLDEVDDEFVEMFGPPMTVEERSAFVQKTSGIWAVEDDELLHWLAESPEASLFHDGAYYEFE